MGVGYLLYYGGRKSDTKNVKCQLPVYMKCKHHIILTPTIQIIRIIIV